MQTRSLVGIDRLYAVATCPRSRVINDTTAQLDAAIENNRLGDDEADDDTRAGRRVDAFSAALGTVYKRHIQPDCTCGECPRSVRIAIGKYLSQVTNAQRTRHLLCLSIDQQLRAEIATRKLAELNAVLIETLKQNAQLGTDVMAPTLHVTHNAPFELAPSVKKRIVEHVKTL